VKIRQRTPTALPKVEPIVPVPRPQPFNDADWLFEPKYDGFRGLVYLIRGSCAIYSKRGNRFSRFRELGDILCNALPRRNVILDGEVVAYDTEGRVSFLDLMRGTGILGYVAFDLLWLRGRDLRGLPLVTRKRKLRRLLPGTTGTLFSVLTIERRGWDLYEAACRLDLEGIVAKRKADSYTPKTRWYKIKNPTYTRGEGRRELFERHIRR
jgi:bifunctional non-homologous end joining protein LigD